MTVAASKEEALAIYQPVGDELIDAIEHFGRWQVQAPEVHRKVRFGDADLRAWGM
ncbi:hypothetical protein K5D56_11015 [Pseudomonas cichorii]|nr:hypothetical protein [Pseudomonas cichorii]